MAATTEDVAIVESQLTPSRPGRTDHLRDVFGHALRGALRQSDGDDHARITASEANHERLIRMPPPGTGGATIDFHA